MKFANGYGSITKLSGKCRKPWMVRITEGRTYDEEKDDFKLNRYVLGYYATRKEALDALATYNKNPYSLAGNAFTFGEIYDIWKKENYNGLSKSTVTSRESAYKYCEPIKDMDIRNIRVAALQDIIDGCPHGSATKKVILILLYTGLRVNELFKNTVSNFNPDEHWIYVPAELAKNRSSIRYVPIHDKVYPFLMEFYNRASTAESGALMVNPSGYPVAYNNFATRNLKKLNQHFETAHRMHDTRHTFATAAHQCGMDQLTTQKILGHSPDTITERVYTHISIDDMKHELEKYSL